jgi:hypothetical protein
MFRERPSLEKVLPPMLRVKGSDVCKNADIGKSNRSVKIRQAPSTFSARITWISACSWLLTRIMLGMTEKMTDSSEETCLKYHPSK